MAMTHTLYYILELVNRASWTSQAEDVVNIRVLDDIMLGEGNTVVLISVHHSVSSSHMIECVLRKILWLSFHMCK